MVASVAERGYAGTRVSDLVELSGVSSRTFYDLFADKHACFVATIEAMLAAAIGAIVDVSSSGGRRKWEKWAAESLGWFGKMVMQQPAAARLCLIEAYAAGPDALKPLEAAIAEVEAVAQRTISDSQKQGGMPADLIAARIGGVLEITRSRLRHGAEDKLPDLMRQVSELALAYPPPPEPFRFTARLPPPREEDLGAYSHAERALRAFAVVVAEKGYTQTTIDDVVAHASMSATTFYANFSGKEDALMAAIDSAGAQIVAAVVPAFERSSEDWAAGVRAAFGALFGFLAARPALARLMGSEIYGAGANAMDRRAKALAPLRGLVDGRGLENEIHLSPVALELMAGGIFTLVYRQIRSGGPETLPSLAPVCTYVVLAPLIGAEEAASIANEHGQVRQGPGARPMRPLAVTRTRTEVLNVLSEQAASASEVAKKLSKPAEEIAKHIDALELSGYIEAVGESSEEGTRTFRIAPTVMSEEESAALSPARRRLVSLQILGMIRTDLDRALAADTFDRRPDHNVLRTPLVVDEAGWDELHKLHDRTLDEVFEIKKLSTRRLEEAGEEGIHARSILLFFEMPPP